MYVKPTMRHIARIWLICALYLFPYALWGQYSVSNDTIRSVGILSHTDTFRLCLTNGVAYSHHFYISTGLTCTGVTLDSSEYNIYSRLFSCRLGCSVAPDTSPFVVAQRLSISSPPASSVPFEPLQTKARVLSTSSNQVHYATEFHTAGTYKIAFGFWDCIGDIYTDSVIAVYIVDTIPVVFPSVTYNSANRTATIQVPCISSCHNLQYAWASGASRSSSATVRADSTHDEIVRISNGICTIYETISVVSQCRPFLSVWTEDRDSVCEGQSVHLHATSGLVSYTWNTGQTDSVISVVPLGTAIFNVTAVDASGCQDTASITIRELLRPRLTITPAAGYTTTVCSGLSVSLNAACTSNCTNVSYTWSNGGTGTTQSFTGLTTTTPVRVTATLGSCPTIATTTITVNPSPTATISSIDSTCVNVAITLTAASVGGTTPRYLWSNAATTSAITITPSALGLQTHSVIVTNSSGCRDTVSKDIFVKSCSNFTITAANDTICGSGSTTITVNNAPQGAHYLWSTGDTTPTITTNSLNANSTFSVTVSGTGIPTTPLQKNIVVLPAFQITANKTALCHANDSVLLSTSYPNIYSVVSFYNSANANMGQTIPTVRNSIPIRAAGTYYAHIAVCSNSNSNSITINTSTLSAAISTYPDSTLCGTTDNATLVATSNCNACSYTWSNGNSTNAINVTTPNTYRLTVGDASTRCSATASSTVTQLSSRITAFTLPTSTQSTGSTISLSSYITITGNTPTGTFTGNGVTGTTFTPSAAGVGAHTITYTYTENGCTFSASSTIQVLSSTVTSVFTNISVRNGDVAYANTEACVGDTLQISISNFAFQPARLEFSDGQGGYVSVTLISSNFSQSSRVFSGTARAIVPAGAKTGMMRLSASANNVVNMNVIVINNPDVVIAGVTPSMCSNGSYTLTGTPSGGVFSTAYDNTFASLVAAVSNTDLILGAISGYNANNERQLYVRYTYSPRYGAGQGGTCRAAITKIDSTTVWNMRLDTALYRPISSSETSTPLPALLAQTTPAYNNTYTKTFAGIGVFDSANVSYFNANLVGVGLRPIVLQMTRGNCTVRDTSPINVISPPTVVGLLPQYCNTSPSDTFVRDVQYPYGATSNSIYQMSVQVSNYITPTLAPRGTQPASQYYVFEPQQATVGQCVVTTIYRHKIYIPSINAPTDSVSYIIGRASMPIQIAAASNANIITNNAMFCRNSTPTEINVSPGGGTLNIIQLNAAGGNATPFSIPVAAGSTAKAYIYTDLLRAANDTTTNAQYRMVYTYGFGACTSTDILLFRIPRPADATFHTRRQTPRRYCANDPTDALIATDSTNPNSSFSVNGLIAPNKVFNPTTANTANGGINVITHTIFNTDFCPSMRSDTFIVFSLPNISFSNSLPAALCNYDSARIINVTHSPIGGTASFVEKRQFGQNTTQGIPYAFSPNRVSNTGLPERFTFVYTYTDPNHCTRIDSISTVVNPPPQVALAPLSNTYCVDNVLTVGLAPFPTPVTGSTLRARRLDTIGTVSNFTGLDPINNPSFSPRIGGVLEEITYYYKSPTTQCANTYKDTVLVNSSNTINTSLNLSPMTPFCFTSDAVMITANKNAAGVGLFYTNAPTPNNGGIVQQSTASSHSQDTAWFVPNQAVTGNIIVSYSVEYNGCSKVVQVPIIINKLPDLFIDYGALPVSIPDTEADTTLCESSRLPINVIDLNSNSSLTPSGFNRYSYSGNGLVPQTMSGFSTLFIVPDSIPQAQRLGYQTITVAYTNQVTGCSNTATDSIKILESPKPSIRDLSSMYCINSMPDTVSGISFASTSNRWICDSRYMRYPTDSITSSNYAIIQFNNAPLGTITKVPLTYKAVYNNGCTNRVTDTITINPPLSLSVRVPNSICNNSTPVSIQVIDAITNADLTNDVTLRLSPAAPAGAFTNGSVLNPRGLAAQPYRVIASYQNAASGCVDMDSSSIINIAAVPDVGIIFSGAANDAYCVGSGTQTITASNNTPSAAITYGTFSSIRGRIPVTNSSPSLVSATVFCDSVRMDTIQYIAASGNGASVCYDTAYKVLQIVGLPTGLRFYDMDSIYCTDDLISIQASPTPNFNTNETGDIDIYPLGSNTLTMSESDNTLNTFANVLHYGAYRIVYNFKNYNNCRASLADTFEVHPKPVASFNQIGFCDHDNLILSSTSRFDTTFNQADTIRHYIWVYNNQAGTDSVATIYPIQRPGTYNASLTVTSGAGCTHSTSKTVIINPYPRIHFEAVGGCQGTNILFVADSTFLGARDTITRAIWDFGNGVLDSTNNIQGSYNVVSVQHNFQQAGVFYPILTLTNNGYCTASDTVRLVISPSVKLYDTVGTPPRQRFEPATYSTQFEEAVITDWYPAQDPAQNEWKWGWAGTYQGPESVNSFDTIHEKVWTTAAGVSGIDGLTPFYNFTGEFNHSSSIYSPCFDFSHSHRPMMKFDYATELDGVDGVCLEYYDDTARQWRRFGEFGRGVHWYNSQSVYSLYNPQMGASSFNGWTNTKRDWQTARYRLDQFLGKRNVRFRLVFNATTSNDIRQKAGFAFDNFSIVERQHQVLVEYFTNTNYSDIINENNYLYGFTHSNLNYKDVALIQYHGNLMPQFDPLYAPSTATQEGNNTRVGRYGIDGLAQGQGRVNVDGNYWAGFSDSLLAQVLDAKMLQDPFFHIKGMSDPKVSLDVTNQTANLRFVVEAAKDLPEAAYFVFPTIVQDSLLMPFLGTFHNVYRTFMHPDPYNAAAGMYYWRDWHVGDTIQVNCSWDYASANISNLNPSQLKAVIFIQGAPYIDTVYQSIATNNFDVRVTPVTEETQAAEELFNLVLYPNPTTDVAFLSFDKPLAQDYMYQLYDMRGVQLYSGIARQGLQQVELNTQDLPQGMYIVTMRDKANSHYVQRKLIVSKP